MEQSSTGLVLSRCAHCGGSLRLGAPWCTLCLTPSGADRELAPADAVDPLTAPLELLAPLAEPSAPARAGRHAAPSPASWPCATCGAANDFDAPACAACGAGFLEAVRLAEPPLLAVPLLGDLSRLGKLQLFGLAVAGVVAVLLLTVVLGALLG